MKNEIEKVLAEETAGSPLFIVEVELTGNHIDVYMDADGGVNLEDCALMNRKLHNLMEEKGVDMGAYLVDVSSPGIDRPLQNLREYKKNVGRKLEVITVQDKTLTGLLVYVDDNGIVLKSGGGHKIKNETINFNQITEAKVTI